MERAAAIEALVAAAAEGRSPVSALDVDYGAADLYGVDGRTLKQWVSERRYRTYRVGHIPVPLEVVEEYVQRAGPSLELDDPTDEEAARLVDEARHGR